MTTSPGPLTLEQIQRIQRNREQAQAKQRETKASVGKKRKFDDKVQGRQDYQQQQLQAKRQKTSSYGGATKSTQKPSVPPLPPPHFKPCLQEDFKGRRSVATARELELSLLEMVSSPTDLTILQQTLTLARERDPVGSVQLCINMRAHMREAQKRDPDLRNNKDHWFNMLNTTADCLRRALDETLPRLETVDKVTGLAIASAAVDSKSKAAASNASSVAASGGNDPV